MYYRNIKGVTFMNDCMEKKIKLEYARAYIILQKYQKLYSLDNALCVGTIFKELYRPYKENNKKHECKK